MTPLEIAAWLDSNPDQVPLVLASLRRTSGWRHSNGVAFLERVLDRMPIAGATHRGDHWHWWAGLGQDRREGTAEHRTACCEAVEAVLRLHGWVLP